jgi:DNA (cytosine-5)-methyltransferase 1
MVEADPACCQTLRVNRPLVPILEGDIRKIETSKILTTAGLKPLEAALVVGGPPCQSFSLAGKRMGMNDPRGQLVLEFVRVVREALPIAFVMENVRGMVNWEGGTALRAILSEFEEGISFMGQEYRYDVKFQVLNAANFGVPQFRERVFLVGNRLGKEFSFPQITHGVSQSLFSQLQPYQTVGATISNLPPADEPSQVAKRVSETILNRIAKHGY